MFIKCWNFYQGLQKFSSLMGFLLHKFAHFVHALRLFKALRLFFLTNFPGPTVIPCPTFIPDSRVHWRIYSRGVVQYIQRREAPRDILLNPEGVYSPIYPCHAHYITIVIGKNKSAIALVIF